MQLSSDKDTSLNDRMSSELDLSLFMMQGIMSPARIKKIRKKYGLIQADFADMIYSHRDRKIRQSAYKTS